MVHTSALARAILIARPPEAVWRIAGDVHANNRWQAGVEDVTVLRGDATHPGDRMREIRRMFGRVFLIDGEVLEYEPTRKLCVRIAGAFAGIGCRICEPVDGGTRLTTTYDLELSGALRPFTALLRLFLGRRLEMDLKTLRGIIER